MSWFFKKKKEVHTVVIGVGLTTNQSKNRVFSFMGPSLPCVGDIVHLPDQSRNDFEVKTVRWTLSEQCKSRATIFVDDLGENGFENRRKRRLKNFK